MPLRWRRAYREKLHGIRTPSRFDPPEAPPDAAAAWRWLRERQQLCAQQAWASLSASPACQPCLDAVLQSYARDEAPALEPDLELARAVVGLELDHPSA